MVPGGSSNIGHLFGGTTPVCIRPPSPPILSISDGGFIPNLSFDNTLPPQVIYKPNNQEINYKQNVIIRWLKPPTPPPPAPIIIRGEFSSFAIYFEKEKSVSYQYRNSKSTRNSSTNHLSTNSTMSSNTTSDYCSVDNPIPSLSLFILIVYFPVNNLHPVLIRANP